MTLLTSEPKQFALRDDGLICWQSDASNPLPGEPVARVLRGESYLTPVVVCIAPEHGDDVREKISVWLHLHITKVLEPLIKLTDGVADLPEPVAAIAQKLHDALGILPREHLAGHIDALDAEMRKILRTRHVKLGPILAFVPDLNRPVAVRLRALLWSLYHGKSLPAPVPKDGAVSVVVDAATADPAFYQSIGYPLYANRGVRIDMLDRVISAVYDSVKDNQFEAQHKMAEWLGCSIPDLYAVLEAMGHRKLHDPADDKPVESDLIAVIPSQADEAPVSGADPVTVDAPVTLLAPDGVTEPTVQVKAAQQIKQPLATFKVWWPRKAKPMGTPSERVQKKERSKKSPGPIERLTDDEIKARQKIFQKDSRQDSHRFDRKKKPSKTEKNLRVVSAAAPKGKPEDSPFAILGTLKFKKTD